MSGMKFKIDGDLAKSLQDYVQAVNEKAIRPAAHAGALTFYEEIAQRVPVDQGTLRKALYRFFDEKRSSDTRKTYLVGMNAKKAPHWHLIELGHWQYFRVVRAPDGRYFTAVRPEAKGKPRPRKRASLAEKLAYYQPNPGGPKWVPPKPYLRPSYESAAQRALEAMKRRLAERLEDIKHGTA